MTRSSDYVNRFTNKPDLSCTSDFPSKCQLAQPCKNYDWNLSFRVEFEKAFYEYGNLIYVPLASFAVDNNDEGTCDIMI